MSGRSWAASGRRRAGDGSRGPRPAGSWAAAVARARGTWDQLTGGPTVDIGPDTSVVGPGELVAEDRLPRDIRYSDQAAAAIMAAALGLWADTAAAMADDDDGGVDWAAYPMGDG